MRGSSLLIFVLWFYVHVIGKVAAVTDASIVNGTGTTEVVATTLLEVYREPTDHVIVSIRDNEEEEEDTNPDAGDFDKERSKEGLHTDKIRTEMFTFDGKVKNYIYLDRNAKKMTADETIVVLTDHNKVYITHDQGTTWEHISSDYEILQIQLNEYNPDDIYLIATHSLVVYSKDRGFTWKSFRTPVQIIPGAERSLYFHPARPAWLIWIGETGCEDKYTCRTVAYVSRAYGKRWSVLQENVNSCQFPGNLKKVVNPNLILCERPATESNDFVSELSYSLDFFASSKKVIYKYMVGLAQSGEFLVAATHDEHDSLHAHVSINGKDWVDSLFPADFNVEKQSSYTLLSGVTKSLFMHITTNGRMGTEYGSIVKSNGNGQDFVNTIDYVNRNTGGYVDFEQMTGLEGIMIVNVVDNWRDSKLGAKKKLKSKITYNDGSHWEYLNPPVIDSNKKTYPGCENKPLKECSLHLHGFSERSDPRDTLSSGSAIGMMIGIGNVGETLGNYYDSNTFFTRDGGVTWKEIKKGVYMWEYGDQGSIIVLVNEKDDTNTILYSVNEGETWEEFKFVEQKVKVYDIATVPSDNSRKFLLFTRMPLHGGDKTRVIQIDFSLYHKRQCSLDLKHPDIDDFEMWTPKHPFQPDNCLFGHQAEYYRKIPGKDCFIGNKLYNDFKIVRDCPCTKHDFECDFNYYRDSSGICKLIPGLQPPDHSLVCKENPDIIEYGVPTGYRKMELSTCIGGLALDVNEVLPCPGKTESFNKLHRNTWKVLLSIVSVFAILFVIYIAYGFYKNSSGAIRLDDEGNFEFMDSFNPKDEVKFLLTNSVSLLYVLKDHVQHYGEKAFAFIQRSRGRRGNDLDAYIVSDDFDEENEFLNDDATLMANDQHTPPAEGNDEDDDDLFSDGRV